MRRKLIPVTMGLLAMLGIACSDNSVEVQNPNSGETKRVLGTPDDAEKLLASYYRRWYRGLYGAPGDNPPATLEGMANIMSVQNYSSLNNECQNSRYPFSGAANTNAPGNGCGGDQANPYFILNEVVRVESNFLSNLAAGTIDYNNDARTNRDKSFAEFLRGVSLGYLALIYDSSSVVQVGQGALDDGALFNYKAVAESSYTAFQRAIDLANAPVTSTTGGFPIPTDWIPTPTALSASDFVKLAKSYRALVRANVARTPAERAAADWTAIIADAQGGITADHYNVTSTTNGPGGGWRRIYDGGNTWHQMPGFIIGMGDTSGSYLAWTKTAVGERGAGNVGFFMVTPDLRFPQGTTRAAQQADFKITDCEKAGGQVPGEFRCLRYFTNRPNGSDQYTGNGWGWSNYDFNRFHWWVSKGESSARNGTLLIFPKAVLDMTQAEGLIRKGQYAAAAALINITRTKYGLPPITANDNTTPVPGGNACVPKTPFGTGPSATLTCGNMMEAMKWEKRMEGAFVQFANWYFDSRGWGDLPEGTALFWAVPYQELQARQNTIYGAGLGAGNAAGSVAAKGTYGW